MGSVPPPLNSSISLRIPTELFGFAGSDMVGFPRITQNWGAGLLSPPMTGYNYEIIEPSIHNLFLVLLGNYNRRKNKYDFYLLLSFYYILDILQDTYFCNGNNFQDFLRLFPNHIQDNI